ncbi:MAG TPA: exopolyphosphatase [Sedimenticola thiotaurini]|uniref:Exopolyphosphatase n=1 Tax=Sedimenticola thiotaurini TaxID=1543721 RepID=A0A831WBW2_9GAMM|nr:exopolyphosphatase [Sedimenticola thiotaurini]
MFPSPTIPSRPPETIAAVDLGSNSFHMIVARVVDNQFQVMDRLREMVRLREGLDARRNLAPEVAQRALGCLERFGQRVRSLPPGAVRAVGTNTLRQVRDAGAFLRAAEAALGHPIEIVAGREEARLVYLGVAHGLAAGDERRLVVDIGGGSTELIVGEGFAPRHMESMEMGCVSMSQAHFGDGRIGAKAMKRAELAGALELRPVKVEYREAGWRQAIGSSGTIRAIRTVVQRAGWCDPRDGITADALRQLRDRLVAFGRVDRIELDGLSTERRPVFAGGVAVLRSVFKALHIERMQVSDLALREGLLYDMLGRIHHEDVRESSVRALCRRYEVDMAQAERVERTARALFAQAAAPWGLHGGEYVEILGWAARLHEIGLTVAHAGYHKHSAYLAAHSDMAGFSRQEQMVLAALMRGHRRRFPLEQFRALPPDITLCAMQLAVLLRLSVLLHRARSATLRIDALLRVEGNRLELEFPDGWLQAHPLPRMELKQEAKRLKKAGFRLKFR